MYEGVKSGRERAHSLVKSSGYDMAGHNIPKKHSLEAEHHMAKGGHPDEAADKALIKKMVGEARIRLRDGGSAEGEMERPRLDRRARGGKSEGHGKGSQVNIAIVPHAGQPGMGGPPGAGMGAGPAAMPPRPPMAPPPVAAPPPRPMPPPGAGMPPGALPPGAAGMAGGMPMRPPGMKSGGHARRQMGGPGMPPPGGAPGQGAQQMTPQQMQAMQEMNQANPPGGGTAMASKKGGRARRKDGGEMMGDGGVDAHLHGGAGSGEGRRSKREREGAEHWGTGA